jgi:glutathione S-transferase
MHDIPDVQLYMFTGSNAVHTAELMLAHKAIAYETVMLKRGEHIAQLPKLGFNGVTVPALKINGRPVQGTRAISRALDDVQPEPRLFPRDLAARIPIEIAERWGEELQNATRRLFYSALERTQPSAIGRHAARHHGATDTTAQHDLALLPARVDQIDDWIAAGVLNNEQLNAADFQIAPNIARLLGYDDIAPYIQGRPAAAHAIRIAGTEHRHIPPAFPDEWLSHLRAKPIATRNFH